MKLIDNIQTTLLVKMMDVYALRNKMTAANVANIDTPGYQRKEVDFEGMLAQELESGNQSKDSIRRLQPTIKSTGEKPVIEDELLEMADTQMRVQLTTRALRHNYEQLKMGIIGRTG
ncbi:MAG: flagellar basal body protein [Balneolaceae bacterium]